jgi:hypothetical protein
MEKAQELVTNENIILQTLGMTHQELAIFVALFQGSMLTGIGV